VALRTAQPRLAEALTALAAASRAVARAERLQPTLEAVVEAAVVATGAELGVVWLRGRKHLVASAVRADSEALAAELEGLRAPDASGTLALLRERLDGGRDAQALSLPLDSTDQVAGSLELLRTGQPFDAEDERLAALAADLAALALHLCSGTADEERDGVLEIAGDALAALSEPARSAARIARLAAVAAGAEGALLWSAGRGGVSLDGTHGALVPSPALQQAAAASVTEQLPAEVTQEPDGAVVTLQLGQPPIGALQLLFPPDRVPEGVELRRLATFGVRAAHALRFSAESRELGFELDRTRALLAVVGEAIARLSLEHTLETALERLAELLGTDRVAVYLEQERPRGRNGAEEAGLRTAAARGLSGPHESVARGLLELALGPLRGRGVVEVEDIASEPLLADVAATAAEAEIATAFAVPLVVEELPIGLLAVYPRLPRGLTPNEAALVAALAAQLSVAVQNARLHEEATQLSRRLERTLALERDQAKRLQALYNISRSFAQSLSQEGTFDVLENTLDVLARSVVTLLEVDAAVIRMPDERGVDFVAHAVHVDDDRVDAAARALLTPPQPLPAAERRRLLESGEPVLLDARRAEELGGALALLAPFLAKGSTAAVIPIATSGELLATLTIVSLHPERPVAADVVEKALSITGQAALAIDNARLYAQQKEFADTMQRSLLPSEPPQLPGLELGDVYESSARVEVGGDVYDYLVLEDGRLAVVLGDVTGHGVQATADMAMAKFVFRSLAREHHDPGDFLAAANEVVASEIATGKFITMVEVVIDPERGEVACACGGHPPPRLVLPDGTVHAIDAVGLALGIDAPQEYEPVTVAFPPGALVVLYTDGVVEARHDGELYGVARFDELLSASRHLPAAEVAQAALESCRGWTDGELADDFAVVVIKRAQ
jgi:GAF domain-containing protein